MDRTYSAQLVTDPKGRRGLSEPSGSRAADQPVATRTHARAGSVVLRGHDPVAFPLYGLGPGWDGLRYVQDLEGQDGLPLRALGLGHHRRGYDAWVLVYSAPRSSQGQWLWPGDEAREAGEGVALPLLELQRPPEATDLDEPRGGPYNRTVVAYASELALAASAGRWTPTTIQVDGRPRDASSWRHAYGWGAFLLDLPEVVVRVVAVGVEPDELALSRVDLCDYRVDPTQRLSVRTLNLLRADHPEERLPLERTRKLHADHHALAARSGIVLTDPRG